MLNTSLAVLSRCSHLLEVGMQKGHLDQLRMHWLRDQLDGQLDGDR
jgi:hypothetical protein